ncbi:DNA polymerase II large subunit [Candidatus Bathyarchaeota archaeon RBG_16_57_9]|nr:MAG: DNA polymerase II large subunit [Candidatus Bathyarchaeota archaeon RBG_16_57_9]
MPPAYRKYFAELEGRLNRLYEVAKVARSKGLDATLHPEPEITMDIADRIEKLIGPKGITQRMRELEGMNRQEMSFKIAQEIALGRFGSMERERAADQAIRTALAIMTEGVTIAPIEGIPKIVIKQNSDRTEFLSVYFAGPIRPAGGTAQALTLVIADMVRRSLRLERYQPSEDAVNRFIEEVRIYERNVRRFQYHVTDEDLELALKNLPVEATGVSTDPFEASNYRDVPGIETNRLRGGALIVVVDGVVGRARKLCGVCDSIGIEGWEWLNKLGWKPGNGDEENKKPTAAFMEEIIVGRPVFSFPNTPGGFRLRYGRARTTGLAACGVHPATMLTLNGFMTTGLQLRIELPGKSAAVCPVDSVEPPVVRLKDGSVVRVSDEETARRVYDQVDRILFNGDILINAGDFIQFNHPLLPAGYDEDQWRYDGEYALRAVGDKPAEELTGISEERIRGLMSAPFGAPTPEEALALTRIDAPLHPRYTYDWSKVSMDQLLSLRNRLAEDWAEQEIRLGPEDKGTLEILLVPHGVKDGMVVLDEAAPILERCLALGSRYVEAKETEPLAQVNVWAGFRVKEKAYVYVGARMGRPEKAKERKMNPYVHGLFPVGNAGGPQRDITRARKGEKVRVELVQRECPACGYYSTTPLCENCEGLTIAVKKCPRCRRPVEGDRCPACNVEPVEYEWLELDLREELDKARRHVGGSIPERIKCVKRLMNEARVPEHLGKAILRARYDLSVFKDGTLRFDLTDIPLTHFKPSEVGVPVGRLRELGYTHDIEGEPLERPDQMLELMVQDIVLPEDCGDYLVKAARFLDDELRDLYKLEPYYSVENRDQLVGHIVVGLAPHTSASIVGRLVGWSKVRNCYAHPYWHAAKRRNCDGDEDAVMLALDPLLNFSKAYLPKQSGGLMDAPLFIIPNLIPEEVDKESHNVDVVGRYPPEFYDMAMRGAKPGDFEGLVDTLGGRLGTQAQYAGFSYTKECSDINLGSHHGAYNTLQTMLDKLDSQMDLTRKLRAVDGQTVALKILNSHFMKDIVGNLRAFTKQGFRCGKCNKKFRRPPLRGMCDRCGGQIQMTVHRGGIEKYLEPAARLVDKYNLGDYYTDRLELVREELDSIFAAEKPQVEAHHQFNLTDFMKPRERR